MTVLFKFTFIISCMWTLRQLWAITTSQKPDSLLKTTIKRQMQDQFQNTSSLLVTFSQKTMS